MKEFDHITTLPILANVKDVNSHFTNFSNRFAQLLGWKSTEEALGKNDYEVPCKTNRFADEFIRLDRNVIETNEKMLALDIQEYASGWKLVLAEKNPLRDESNNVIGIYSNCIDVSNIPLFKSYLYLHQFDNKLSGQELKPASYILTNAHNPLSLTDRQDECLFLLVRGKSIKVIAKTLHISPRTVEDHLTGIKHKMGCRTKSQLIEKAMEHGFLYYVPSYFQHSFKL